MRALVLALLLTPLASLAQTTPDPGTGLSASVQGGQFDILVPVWSGERLAIVPSIGLNFGQDVGTDVRGGLAARFYQRRSQIAPYFGLRTAVLFFIPADSEFGPDRDTAVDFLVGAAYGAEAFLLPKLSLGVEAQLNLTVSGEESARFGNPGNLNVNTAAAVFATVYF
ncbi:MAG: hypothetical protein AAGI91_02675 [Bacteroidota bacterium]